MKTTEGMKNDWKKVVESAAKARFQVQTGVAGTKNLLVAKYEGKTIIDAFAADDRRLQQALGEYQGYQCLAYGTEHKGEAALVDMADGTIIIFGKGRKSGKLIFVQQFMGNFTIVHVDDTNPDNKKYMRIVGTADEVLVSIIIELLKDSVGETETKRKLLDFVLEGAEEENENNEDDKGENKHEE